MDLSNSYSEVAKEYADRIFDELSGKPMDRQILASFAELIGSGGVVCDLGCGPGHVTKFLSSKNVKPFGIDISPGMIEQATRLNPSLDFRVGDMLSLPLADESLHGVVAFYSLIHINKDRLPRAFSEIRRVLKTGGFCLFSFHIGDETVHLEEWWGHEVNLDFHFFKSKEISKIVSSCGFEIVDLVERDPYEENIEHQSRRAYFLVEKTVNF